MAEIIQHFSLRPLKEPVVLTRRDSYEGTSEGTRMKRELALRFHVRVQ